MIEINQPFVTVNMSEGGGDHYKPYPDADIITVDQPMFMTSALVIDDFPKHDYAPLTHSRREMITYKLRF
jgi:hypothetical protein